MYEPQHLSSDILVFQKQSSRCEGLPDPCLDVTKKKESSWHSWWHEQPIFSGQGARHNLILFWIEHLQKILDLSPTISKKCRESFEFSWQPSSRHGFPQTALVRVITPCMSNATRRSRDCCWFSHCSKGCSKNFSEKSDTGFSCILSAADQHFLILISMMGHKGHRFVTKI